MKRAIPVIVTLLVTFAAASGGGLNAGSDAPVPPSGPLAGASVHGETGVQPGPVEVRETPDPALRARRFTATEAECLVTWVVFDGEPNEGVVRHYASCGGSFARQCWLTAAIATRVFGDPGRRRTLRTLTWGRLTPDGATDTPMSARLALAALESSEWDRRLGRPKGGDINGSVRDLANEAAIYPEVAEILRRSGITATVATVEKVLVVKASTLPLYTELARRGARAGDLLPFDCQVWFRLVPSQEGFPSDGG